MNQQAQKSRDIMACLGDASRFRLVLSLLEREQCVTELARRVGLSQSCTTRHLQFLEREGMVRGLRQGKRVVFHLRADRPRVRELLAWVVGARSELEDAALSGAYLHTDGPVREAGGQSPPPPERRRRPARAASVATEDRTGGLPAGEPEGQLPVAAGESPGLSKRGELEDWLL